MKIGIIGLGYVGLPLACALLCKTDHEVVGFDVDEKKIESIKNGYSELRDEHADKVLKESQWIMSNSVEVLEGSEVFLVCVPTPVVNGGTPDLRFIESALSMLSPFLKKNGVVVIESTVNPGVCEEFVIPLLEKETGLLVVEDFNVVHCPERINPGDEKWNVYNIPRNIGGTSISATKRIAGLYKEFISGEIHQMSGLKEVEATKIVENTFRDINIAYVNELAQSFSVLGIDLKEVIQGASSKPFGFMPHFPSCGVGGHCIPVDPYYLIERAKKSGFHHRFLELAREINNSMPAYTIELLREGMKEVGLDLATARVGLLGLAYKSGVPDLRESPALKIQELLEKRGVLLSVFDPYFLERSTVSSLSELLDAVDVLVLATAHQEFRTLSASDFDKHDVRVVIDGQNCLDGRSIREVGVCYKGIGV